jgi:hypothetical protein
MMKKSISAAVIVAAFGTASPANAFEKPLNGAPEFIRFCETTTATEQISCMSFLVGVYSATIAIGQVVGPPLLCPSHDVSGEEMLATLRDYVRRHPPSSLPDSASVLALLAFREAYGCKR